MKELKIVRLVGDPYFQGYTHGKTLKEEIRKIFGKMEEGLCAHEGKFWGKVIFRVLKQIPKGLNKYIPVEFKKEIQGIADGAGLKYSEILMMNLAEELATIYLKYFRWIKCSCFVARDNKGRIIIGRNLDYDFLNDILVQSSILLLYFPNSGLPFLSLTWPGMINAFTSFSRNLSLFLLESPAKGEGWRGIPGEILTRKITQQCIDLNSAIKEIELNPTPVGKNIILASEYDACLVEISPRKVATQFLSDYIVTTNHYQIPEMKGEQSLYSRKPRKISIPEEFYTLEGSIKRAEMLNHLLQEKSIDVERAKEILKEVSSTSTLQSIIFIPKEGDLYIATSSKTPVTEGSWIYLNLKTLI